MLGRLPRRTGFVRRILTFPNRAELSEGRTGERCEADETRGGLGAAMEGPDGILGSGWDVRLETPEREALSLPPSPTDSGPGPSVARKQTSKAHPTGWGKLEGGDGARTNDEAIGSGSGSPDENVNKRSNPPSPREPVPASPEAESARTRDDAGISAPSSPLPHQIPAAFEQRRRDALAAKQRRLDDIVGRVSSGSSGSRREDARATRVDASDAGTTAATPAAPTTANALVGAPSAVPSRVSASPARSKRTDSDVDEDWDDLLADATPVVASSSETPPAKTTSSVPWRALEPTPEPSADATSPVAEPSPIPERPSRARANAARLETAEATAVSRPGGSVTPRRPSSFSFPSTPEVSGRDERRASPTMDKLAAARRIMAAASPGRQLSRSAAKEPVANVLFSPPPKPSRSPSATSTPRPSRTPSPLARARSAADAPTEAPPSGSASATPDARKRAAARRIVLAAAARKASVGVPFDAASLRSVARRSEPGTPKPAPFESPISPIPPAGVSPADASPADETVPPRRPDREKPLAARGLGSALEANAASRATRRGAVDIDPIDPIDPNASPSPESRFERVEAPAGRTAPARDGRDGGSGPARAASETATRAGASRPKAHAPALGDARDDDARAPETATPPRASSDSADAFAFDAPKRVEARPSDAPDDDAPSADGRDADAGYGAALETPYDSFSASVRPNVSADGGDGDDVARDARGALERAETLAAKLEESEFLREALETRVAEAERVAEQALARKQAHVGDQLESLKAEVDRNAYLRRLLKKAEQRRGEARAREREAAAKFEALRSSAHRDAATFALRIDRYEEETQGMRRRVSAEKARSQALERAVSRANVELAEQHRRRQSASRLLGMAVAAIVVLVLRVLAGGRDDAPGTAGGYPGGREAYVADTAARAANAARANPSRAGGAAGFGPAV